MKPARQGHKHRPGARAAVYDHLLNMVTIGQIVLDDIITHRIPLNQAEHGFKIFNQKEEGCVKVVLKPWE